MPSETAGHVLFNQIDLTGWQVPVSNTEFGWWRVSDGVLVCQSDLTQTGSILWTDEHDENFVFETEFLFGEGTVDSGVFLRDDSQQIQIGISGSLKRDMTGSLYVPKKSYAGTASGVDDLLELEDWNTLRIQVIGATYTVWLNGQEVMVFESENVPESGPIGLQLHAHRDMKILFRGMRVWEL